MSDEVRLEIKDNTALITLNRPETLNAINMEVIEELHKSLDKIEEDEGIKAVIITGKGRAFCSGGDFNHPLFSIDTFEERRPLIERIYEFPKRIRRMPTPFIAAINGPALGGGVTLAAVCDLRIAAQCAFFRLNYIEAGVLPDMGCSYLLPHLVGTSKAIELAMLAEKFDANEAFRIGLVAKITPDDQVLNEAYKMANHLSNYPPLAIRYIKHALYKLPSKSLEDGLAAEGEYFNYLLGTNDCREGAKAFIEKRPPRFSGS